MEDLDKQKAVAEARLGKKSDSGNIWAEILRQDRYVAWVSPPGVPPPD